jgi:hypothetical protein
MNAQNQPHAASFAGFDNTSHAAMRLGRSQARDGARASPQVGDEL